MKILLLFFAHLLASVASTPMEAIHDATAETGNVQPSVLSKSVSGFNNKMFEKISQQENGNIFYSPFGLHILLSQVYMGAPKNTTTSQELALLLDLNPKDDDQYLKSYGEALATQDVQLSHLHNGSVVRIANKMYINQDMEIQPKFESMTAKCFKSSIQKVRFSNTKETSDTINNFVNNATNGLIDKIFEESDMDPNAAMILLNAIYFKGNWKYPFNKSETTMRTFHTDHSTKSEFSAMVLIEDLKTCHVKELDANVLELPYQNEQISMVVILPSKTSDVQQVERKLKKIEATSLIDKLDSTDSSEVEVILPKFEMKFEVKDIINSLKNLGVKSIFDSPDLSLISKRPLEVSDIVQKAAVKVNEEGSEAAAVSGSVLVPKIGSFPKEFVVNRPFIFYIYDRVSHLPLFVGRIVDPNGLAKLNQQPDPKAVKDPMAVEDPKAVKDPTAVEDPKAVEAPHVVRIVVEAPDDVVNVVVIPPVGGKAVDHRQQHKVNVVVDDSSSPCDHLGYNLNDQLPETMRLPCRGHDTIALKEHQDQQELIQNERLADFNKILQKPGE